MASLLSPLVVLLLSVAVVVDAVSPTYTLRASDSIGEGYAVAMSGNGLVSLATANGAVLAVATSPGAVTTKYSLSLPSPCDQWDILSAMSLSGNMFAICCVDSSTARDYLLVYQTMNPSTPFAMIPNNYYQASLSEDGTILACTDSHTVAVLKLSMGTYSSIQTISPSVMVNTLSMAPDASALAVSDTNSATAIYGWVGNQFVLAPMMPLNLGCYTLSISAQSAAGATTIACADPNFPASPVFSLVNMAGALSVTSQASIPGSLYFPAITPDGSTVAVSDISTTKIYSATTGSLIATVPGGASSLTLERRRHSVVVRRRITISVVRLERRTHRHSPAHVGVGIGWIDGHLHYRRHWICRRAVVVHWLCDSTCRARRCDLGSDIAVVHHQSHDSGLQLQHVLGHLYDRRWLVDHNLDRHTDRLGRQWRW